MNSLMKRHSSLSNLFADMFGDDPFGFEPFRKYWGHDITDDKDNYYFKVVLPGFLEENIKVEVKSAAHTETIVVSAEYSAKSESEKERLVHSEQRQYRESFTVPKGVETDKIDASYTAGVLVVTMPKKPSEERYTEKTKEIKIKSEIKEEAKEEAKK